MNNFIDYTKVGRDDFAKRETLTFAREHVNDDTARLLLSAARYPSIDMPAAVQQIEGLRTARDKWPSLLACEGYQYPPRLNREQASSEATARYKVASGMWEEVNVADLTGGMGIDTLAFAQVAAHVDYVEHDPALCSLMEHNCQALGINNITIHCADSIEWIARQGKYDLLFIDPARRSASGRKVAAFEECQPDILQHLDLLQDHCHRLMVKASPMIDLSLAIRQLRSVAEVHIVALQGECKEVLFLCDSTHDGPPVMHCTDLKDPKDPKDLKDPKDFKDLNVFSFTREEEATAELVCCDIVGQYLYDPHAALRKGGCFRLLGQRYQLPMLAPNSHLYTSPTLRTDFPGRTFEVLQELSLNRKAIHEVLPDGKAHVVVRNFPTEAATLQKQLGLREGGDRFVIATTIGNRRTAFLCKIT